MPLQIVRAADPMPVENLVVTIFGAPGLGKSTLAFSAVNPILFDFDKGSYRALGRKDTQPITEWSDLDGIPDSYWSPFDTIIVDTAGRALKSATAAVRKMGFKMCNGKSLSLQGFGELKSQFSSWLDELTGLGKDVILVCHSTDVQKGDSTVQRLDAAGGSKDLIHQSSDAIGRLYEKDGKRWLDFSPFGSNLGKNPGCLEAQEVPDHTDNPHFFADVIQSIKDKLNSLTAEQSAMTAILTEWGGKISDAVTPEDFTLLAIDAKGLTGAESENVKRLIWGASKTAGFGYDIGASKFIKVA